MDQRLVGSLFIVGAVAFAIAASVLSASFDWPAILRQPASVVLPKFHAGGTGLVWIWFATAWTYAILLIPILLLPPTIGLSRSKLMRVATYVGAASVVLSVVGFLRWVFVVPPLAAQYAASDTAGQIAVGAAWVAQHQFGGTLLGEHLGEGLGVAWSALVAVTIFRHQVLPAWLGWTGLIASVLYFLNQGDIMATAVPGFPVIAWAGLVGSGAWALWIIALGAMLALQRQPRSAA